MTTYLIDKKEAKKNKCKYNKLPILRLILFLLSVIILYFVPYFIPVYYPNTIKTIIYIIWIIYLAIGIYKYVKTVKLIKMIEQEAIIKKDDTFYLVRLLSNKEDIVVDYKNKIEYIYKTLINNVKQLLDNYDYDARTRKLKKEEYEEALKKGLEKDAKWIITSDLKNNLDVYLKDKKCHIQRLDELTFVKEKKNYYKYTFKNCGGKNKTLRIYKCYNGLKEDIDNTKIKKYNESFPYYVEKPDKSYHLFILIFIILIIFILSMIFLF
ncbi:MAG: hypothetical protein MR296_04195 [Tenericutes bacterium]|nr:hypothetical protein [Mycoplasmatota bacterium]